MRQQETARDITNPNHTQKENRDVDQLSIVDFVVTKRKFFSRRISVVHLRRQWSSAQNDHQRQKSNDETRVKNPQSHVGLMIWQNQFGPQNPNQIRWHREPTRGNVDQRWFYTWWVDHLLRLLNIMNFSMFSCGLFFRTESRVSCPRELMKARPKKVWR